MPYEAILHNQKNMDKYWKFTLCRSYDEKLGESVYTANEMP